jgi:DUF177 domain-containing protein
MKLNLDTLPAGRSDLDVDAVYAIDPDEESVGEVAACGSLTVDNTDAMVVVGGTLKAEGTTDCDRCLVEFTLRYEAAVDIQIVRTTYPAPDEELDNWILHQARGVIDLTAPLRESVVIALPQKRVCDDDCKGICAQCGANRNQTDCDCSQEQTDPRWDALPS